MSLESENIPVTLVEILAAMRASQELMRKHGESALKQAFKEFFDACPEIEEIYWTQFAPYFNDGEPCVFSVNEPKLVPNKSLLAEDLAEVIRENFLDVCFGEKRGWGPSLARPISEREKFILDEWEKLEEAFSEEDLFEGVFGSDCSVEATREGFDISDVDHD